MTETETAEWKTAADLAARRAGFLRDLLRDVPDVGTLADRALSWLAFVRLHAPPLHDSDVVALTWAAGQRLMLPVGFTLTNERLAEADSLADFLTGAAILADHAALATVGWIDASLLDRFRTPFAPHFTGWLRRKHRDDEEIRRTGRPATDREWAILRVMHRIAATIAPRDEAADLRACRIASKLIERDIRRCGGGTIRLRPDEVRREAEALWWTSPMFPAGLDDVSADGHRHYSVTGLRNAIRRGSPDRNREHPTASLDDLHDDRAPSLLAEVPAADAEDPAEALADVELARIVRSVRETLTTAGERAALLHLEGATQEAALTAEGCTRGQLRAALPRLRAELLRALRGYAA